GDGELFCAAPGEDLLDGTGTGHPVTDHDQFASGVCAIAVEGFLELCYRIIKNRHQTSTRPTSTMIEPVRPSGAAMYSSIAVPPSRSSTTRNGTCQSDFAPIGK